MDRLGPCIGISEKGVEDGKKPRMGLSGLNRLGCEDRKCYSHILPIPVSLTSGVSKVYSTKALMGRNLSKAAVSRLP